ncbi:hypothetical protein [Parafrankia sp. FMc2]|uniref:hypothetical protein n=1 Tax=Parafrankia sp. FMc2 TaxID=3233196 RepID=UPI0034D6F139
MKHALPRPTPGGDNGGRPWPTLPNDTEPKRWVVIVDGTPKKTKSSKDGGR